MKKIIILFCLTHIRLMIFGQDIHFSQYNQTPSLISPALTGMNSVIRASIIYKDQWRSVTVPYKTFGASIEMKFKGSNWDKAQPRTLTRTYKKAFSRAAGGLSFYSDKAGDGNMGSTQVNLSLATYVPINKNTSISVGLQGSLVQRTIDFSKLIFPDQYTGIGTIYNPSIDPGENYQSNNFIYPDFSAGIAWSYGYSEKAIGANNQFKANAGVAAYHLNQPKQKFLVGTNQRLKVKYVIHGDFTIGIKNTNVAIAPSYLLEIQNPSTELVLGTMIKYYFHEDSKYTGYLKKSAIGIGGFYRNKDAFIASLIVEYQNYAIGFSYDVNTSKLTTASMGRGGIEIFIRIVTPNPFLNQTNSKAKFN